MAEAEQTFFNEPLLVLEDSKHSNQEPRFHALKSAAHARDVPYQSLIKVWLQEKLHEH